MKSFLRFFALFLLILTAAACGKRSGLEGAVLDGNGRPLAGLTVIARQVSPVRGYEEREAVTGRDGAFRLTKLFPSAKYVLTPLVTDWTLAPVMSVSYTESALLSRDGWVDRPGLMLRAAPEGQTRTLQNPIVIQPAVSVLFGKAVDGKGLPLRGVEIAAEATRPVKGCEGSIVVTGEDGAFRLDKLLPDSVYRLTVRANPHTPGRREMVRAGPVGKEKGIPLPVRFWKTADGVMVDSAAGLEWTAGPEQGLDWEQAGKWAASLPLSGGRWTMPSRKELLSLKQGGLGATGRQAPLLPLARWDVWSGETDGASRARIVNLASGREAWSEFSFPNGVLAVRTRNKI
ncbi:MAG: carboxypeptidase-like regulatory domain-containing protein [Thermodesulfobacteriota bacterium]